MSKLPFSGRGHFQDFRPGFRFSHICHVDRHGHFTLKQLRLPVLNESHTNSYTGPRLLSKICGNIGTSLKDICGVTLSVYPHRASLKNMPGHGGIRTYEVVGSNPTVAGHIFQARPVWIYTQSNTTNIIFT